MQTSLSKAGRRRLCVRVQRTSARGMSPGTSGGGASVVWLPAIPTSRSGPMGDDLAPALDAELEQALADMATHLAQVPTPDLATLVLQRITAGGSFHARPRVQRGRQATKDQRARTRVNKAEGQRPSVTNLRTLTWSGSGDTRRNETKVEGVVMESPWAPRKRPCRRWHSICGDMDRREGV